EPLKNMLPLASRNHQSMESINYFFPTQYERVTFLVKEGQWAATLHMPNGRVAKRQAREPSSSRLLPVLRTPAWYTQIRRSSCSWEYCNTLLRARGCIPSFRN